MFDLTIKGTASLVGYNILLFGPLGDDYGVACVCFTYSGGLPSVVELGSIRAYATQLLPGTCNVLRADLVSGELQQHVKLIFTGSAFVSGGEIDDFAYAIHNASTYSEVTVGLARCLSRDGEQQAPYPIDQRRLGKNMTALFDEPNDYWIGAGRFAAPDSIGPGLVLPVSVLTTDARAASQPSCAPTLTEFTRIDLTKGTGASAIFSEESNVFEIHYSV